MKPVSRTPSSLPKKVSLPADEAPHRPTPSSTELPMEWWYYSGHLKNEKGKEYGYSLAVFQNLIGPDPDKADSYQRVIDFAVTDPERGYHHTEATAPGPYPQTRDGFELAIPPTAAVSGGPKGDRITADTGDGYQLTLDLKATKPPVLHNGNGHFDYQGGGHDFYYSKPRMQTKGTLTVNGVPEKVTGETWFDHEWGHVPACDWDWYSAQLDNGKELLTYAIHKPGTQEVLAKFGTFIDDKGAATPLGPKDFTMKSTGSWKSPDTGTDYPNRFEVTVPPKQLTLSLTPVMDGQEVPEQGYVEADVRVRGTENGKPVEGKGYVELLRMNPKG